MKPPQRTPIQQLYVILSDCAQNGNNTGFYFPAEMRNACAAATRQK